MLDAGYQKPTNAAFKPGNLAPAQPLADARKTANDPKSNSSSVAAIFREIHQQCEAEQEVERREILLQGLTIGNLMNGKLVMKRNFSNTGFYWFPKRGGPEPDSRSNYPVFGQNCEILKSKWGKIKPTVVARVNGDDYRADIQANYADRVVQNKFLEIFNVPYEADEIHQAMMFGGYNTQFYYNNQLERLSVLAPIIKNEMTTLMDGYGACLQPGCAFEGKPKDFQTDAAMPQCPKCGSYNTTKMLEPTTVQQAMQVGIRKIIQGDVSGKILPFTGHKFDMFDLASKSSYNFTKEWMPTQLVHKIFGNLDFDGDLDSQDIGLQVQASLALHGGNIENLGQDYSYRPEFWKGQASKLGHDYLTAERLAGYRIRQDEKTVNGDTIPADVDFSDLWPNGVCVQHFNSCNFITGIYEEEANISAGLFFTMPNSGVGKGLSDTVDIAKDLNEVHSMTMESIKRHGATGIFYDKKTLTLADVRNLFRPGKAVAVDLQKNANLTNINQAVGQLNLNPVNPELLNYTAQLMNLFNLVFMTGDFTQGILQDVDIDTLGGQELATAKAEEQKGSVIDFKVYHRCQAAEIITKLTRLHVKFPVWYGNANSNQYGRVKGKHISGDMLPEKVYFDYVPGSERPVNDVQKRTRAREMAKEAGGLGALAMAAAQAPELTAWWTDQFGVALPMLDQEEIKVKCIDRIDQISQLSKAYDDPQFIVDQLKVKMREESHLLKARFLESVLDDDEADEWSPVMAAAVDLLIETHYQLAERALFTNETYKQRAQIALAAQGQELANAIQQPQQIAAQAAEAGQGLVEKGIELQADEEKAKADAEREMLKTDQKSQLDKENNKEKPKTKDK